MEGIMHLLSPGRTGSMLRITTEKKRGKTVLSVEGRLAGQWVTALEQCWRERAEGEKFSVDLCGVSFIDAAGKALLAEIHQQGGKLVAEGCLNQAIVREISKEQKDEKDEKPAKGSKRTPIIFYVLFLGLSLASANSANAQTSS